MATRIEVSKRLDIVLEPYVEYSKKAGTLNEADDEELPEYEDNFRDELWITFIYYAMGLLFLIRKSSLFMTEKWEMGWVSRNVDTKMLGSFSCCFFINMNIARV